MKNRNYAILILSLLAFGLFAQQGKESERAWLIGASLSANDVSGEWVDRYRENYSVSAFVGRKFSSNWTLTAEWSYLFGGEVNNRADALKNVFTPDEQLINISGGIGQVNINQRATFFNLGIEKTIPIFGLNKNSGLNIGLTGGYIWHWLNVDNVGNDSPQIIDEYEKGYDRLGQGFLLRESLGFIYLSPNRLLNFKVSFEVSQIWSQDMRKYYYPIGELNSQSQLNLLYGLRLNWYIPIYLGGKTEQYYYN